MAKNTPADVIEAYRRRQGRRSRFTFGDVSKALFLLFILASSGYVLFTGEPELPPLVELMTNTPTYTPSITPTPTQTATNTLTPTETLDLNNQCNCPEPQILVVTATFSATETQMLSPTVTNVIEAAFSPTVTLPPTQPPMPTATRSPTSSATFTPTQFLYIVQSSDTLGAIALRYGVTVESIQVLNNLDTTMIYVGQILQIPSP